MTTQAERDALAQELIKAARAVVDRWETPLWKDTKPTAEFIYALRNAADRLAAAPAGEQPVARDFGKVWAVLVRYGVPVAGRREIQELWDAAPAPAPSAPPLTQEQVEALRLELGYAAGYGRFALIVRAIERAHGIGATHAHDR